MRDRCRPRQAAGSEVFVTSDSEDFEERRASVEYFPRYIHGHLSAGCARVITCTGALQDSHFFVRQVGRWPGTVGEDIMLTCAIPEAGSSPACLRNKVEGAPQRARFHLVQPVLRARPEAMPAWRSMATNSSCAANARAPGKELAQKKKRIVHPCMHTAFLTRVRSGAR